jgi:hypothetical protein
MYNFLKNLVIIFSSFTICFVLLCAYTFQLILYIIFYTIRIFKKTIKNTINATKSIF